MKNVGSIIRNIISPATKQVKILLLIIAFASACAGQANSSDPFEIKIKKIRDDIYVAYRPEPLRYIVEGNVTIIINDDDVVVVDAGGSPRSARRVIAEIRKLTDKPVRYLINTHGHGDHTIGNQEYMKAFPGLEIIAHEKTREYIAGRGYNYVDEIAASTESRKKAGEEEISRLKAEDKPDNQPVIANLEQYYRHDIDIRQKEYRKVKRTPPTLVVSDALRLHRGNRVIEILHLGAGDTASDLVVYLPVERIVCTGDMITEPVPYGYSRHPLEWLQTLVRLSQLDFETLIPGHGEIQKGKAYLNMVRDLLASVQRQVKVAISEGLDMEGARKKVDLSDFANRFAQDDPVCHYFFQLYFLTPNVERTFNEIKAKADQK